MIMTLERNTAEIHDAFHKQNPLNENFVTLHLPSDIERVRALLLDIILVRTGLSTVQVSHSSEGVIGQGQGRPFRYNQNRGYFQRY